MKYFLVLIAVLSFSYAQANQSEKITWSCELPSKAGQAVVEIKTDEDYVLEAREISISSLTGAMTLSEPLQLIKEGPNRIYHFNLGFHYTVSYSLEVLAIQNPIKVTFVEYDRDDGMAIGTNLICKKN